VQADGSAVSQRKQVSSSQVGLQPSPAAVFPSSQTRPAVALPLPQLATRRPRMPLLVKFP
jgi:hypothetical protein